MTTSFFESAKTLIDMGFSVFPVHGIQENGVCACDKGQDCNSPGKHPILNSWQTMATVDPDTLRKWAKKHPTANVGVVTGKKSNLTVLDVDGEIGLASLNQLIEAHGPLPETIKVVTGSGGAHYYFTYCADLKTTTSFLPGLDIRNDGGLVVAPNSQHAAGKSYVFASPLDTTSLADVPSFLLAAYCQAKESSTSKTALLGEGERNDGLFKIGIAEWHRGRTQDELWNILAENNEARCKPPLPEKELRQLYKSILHYQPELPAYDEQGKRNIFLGRDQLIEVADLVTQELVSQNKKRELLFRNHDTLVQQYPSGDAIRTRAINLDLMMLELCRKFNWYTERYKQIAPSDPSEKLIKLLMTGIDLNGFRVLKGVCEWPLVHKSGVVITKRGYHPEIERIVALPASFNLETPETPSAEEVKAAVQLLQDDLLSDFPFADDASRANAMAAMLQLFCGDLMEPPYPLHFFQAPMAGTGKSLLVKAICGILFGQEPSIMTLGENDAETRKRLSGQLFSLAPYVFFDNLPPKVHSNALAAALTTTTWSDRLLGGNIIKKVDVNALWMATGNNVVFSNELARRIVLVELEPADENPSSRSGFKHPKLLKWVYKNREALIRANLILIRNWFAQGQPKGQEALGSYESYSMVIGGILQAAGIQGFLKNRTNDFLNQDDETTCWNHIVQQWYLRFGETPISAGKLLTADVLDEEFLSDFFAAGDRHTSMGMKLSQVKNRVFNGLKITAIGRGERGQKLYKLKKISGNLKSIGEVY